MKRKLTALTLGISLVMLLGMVLPLHAQSAACDIGVWVRDAQGNPKANTPVKLTALDSGGQYLIRYTNSNGVAIFQMNNWPNECPGSPCCPATWNAGDYRARAMNYCAESEGDYDGSNLIIYVTTGPPCLGE